MSENVAVVGDAPITTQAWRWSPPRDTWLIRLFDNTGFLAALCLVPALGLLLVFLTYPLGLGVWLAFTDTRIGRAGVWVGLDNFDSLWHDRIFWLSRHQHPVLYSRRYGREVRARPVAGPAAEQQHPVQVPHPRHRAGPLDRAHRALGDRVLVDL